MGSFMKNWAGTDQIPCHSQLSPREMATASKWDELEDYSKKQMNKTVRQIEKFDGKENDESAIDNGGGGDEEVRQNDEVFDLEDEVPLLTLQQTWPHVKHAPRMKPTENL